jgi:hypothetical protein
MREEGRQRVWRLYGRFCGLMVCGSCFGAVTWAAIMMSLVNGFNSRGVVQNFSGLTEQWSLLALSRSWGALFSVSYAIEFMCLSAAQLMVLDRMSEFAAGQDEGTRKRWAAGGRVVMAVVVLGNAVGLAANIAAAVHGQRAAEAASTASAFWAANNPPLAIEHMEISRAAVELALSISAVQQFCEVAVLLLIVAAFIVAGVVCARIVSSRLLAVDAASAPAETGRELRRQIVVTTAVVFVAFVLRSVQSTMNAVSRQLQDTGTRCPGVGRCDLSCINVFTQITEWIIFTPEFQVTVVLVSSPLTLLVALWGMTSKLTLQLMKPGAREMASLGQRDLLGSERVR